MKKYIIISIFLVFILFTSCSTYHQIKQDNLYNIYYKLYNPQHFKLNYNISSPIIIKQYQTNNFTKNIYKPLLINPWNSLPKMKTKTKKMYLYGLKLKTNSINIENQQTILFYNNKAYKNLTIQQIHSIFNKSVKKYPIFKITENEYILYFLINKENIHLQESKLFIKTSENDTMITL